MDKNEGNRTPENGDASFFYQTLILNPYGCICELKPELDFILNVDRIK